MSGLVSHRRLRDAVVPCSLGLWSAAVAVAPGTAAKLALAVPLAGAALTWWAILKPHRWLLLFFVCLLLTPPIAGPIGDAGLHAAPAFALIGLLCGLVRRPEWDRRLPPLALALLALAAVLLASVGFAAFYSGAAVAAGSLLRVGLFLIAVYVFLYASRGPRDPEWNPFFFVRFLFIVATFAAIFACADFYFQFPAPAGFEPQFVWLSDAVLRRAQGLFYEASTLGNFCAFFLVMIAVALFRPRAESPCPRLWLVGGGVAFTTALILSYSRASALNLVVALGALAGVRGAKVRRSLPLATLVLTLALAAVAWALPSFFASYLARIVNSVQFFSYSPNGVLSGRLEHWTTLWDFVQREPWHAIFGVGYKTLPYSSFTGEPVIADNTYLDLLVETGLVGLGAFLILNAAILRYSLRAARSARSSAAFFGEWIFCFWAGQLAQMFSGDLITYWRVLPVYFWVLGTAVRETEWPD